VIGGLPDEAAREVRGAIHLPKLLSVLAKGDPDATVVGLDQFDPKDWPPVTIVHIAFQIMVACGVLMLLLVVWAVVSKLRKRPADESRAFLRAAVLAGPLGLIAVEAGWIVTEVGRQPWIISGVMRVKDAVTPMPGLIVSLLTICAVYALLGVVVLVLLYRHVLQAPEEG
jgi:cytochrome d ubiquinol oxidase subunit I